MIQFQDSGHCYSSVVPDSLKWLSVTTVVSALKEKFDPVEGSKKSSKNPKSKWYGISPEEIQQIWSNENKRSTDLGHWYHRKRELELMGGGNIYTTKKEGNTEYAQDQRMSPGTYLEYIVYLTSAAIAGKVDRIEVQDNKISIHDYKTNKEIKRSGFVNWEGVSKKMLSPLQHLEECEFNSYAVQLSLYAYILSRHNPLMDIGKLEIEHIKFEVDHLDKYGYPVIKLDSNNEPIVSSIEFIELPYLKQEAIKIIDHLRNNRSKFIK